MTPEHIIDYPDPVVVSYMERVRQLSPAARDHLDLHVWKPLRDGAWLSEPSILIFAPCVLLGAAWLIRGAKRSSSMVAEIAYERFFDDLRRQGWTVAGRGRAGMGLTVVRCRAIKPALAFRAYRERMDAFVPHQAIGWAEPGESLAR